jgi:Zyg-11 family protein
MILFQVSGNANEDQLLVAAVAYIERPDVVYEILTDLVRLSVDGTLQNIRYALYTVMQAMDRHPTDEDIQIYGG